MTVLIMVITPQYTDMMKKEKRVLVQWRVSRMANSFITDGYRVKFRANLDGSVFIKLQHCHNASGIALLGNFKTGKCVAFRSGKKILEEYV